MADTIKLSDLTERFTAVTEDELFEISEYQGIPGDYESKKVKRSRILGYSDFHAKLTQTGTSAPTKNELIANLGATVSFVRNSVGNYTCNCVGAFSDPDKISVYFGNEFNIAISDTCHISVVPGSFTNDSFDFYTRDSSDAFSDDILEKTSIEIRKYY